MSRVAGRILAAAFGVLAATPLAVAADMADVLGGDCRAPRVYVTSFKEQICTRGAAGYASCRWVGRTHAVEVPADCGPRATIETSRPATRGAFPRG